MQQKIVFMGSPGSGKTSVLNALLKKGFYCFEEISREVTLAAQKKGIDQLFLKDPLLFSKMLLDGRKEQFTSAQNKPHKLIFFDRGIPDVFAYLDYVNEPYPNFLKEQTKKYRYDKVFHFEPWKAIYTTDNERYETFNEAIKIDTFLKNSYSQNGYHPITVPFGSVLDRTHFILNTLKNE